MSPTMFTTASARHRTAKPNLGSIANAVKHGFKPPIDHDALVKQSQKLVAQTFFGTLLKQMHDSPFSNNMMDGGKGGKAFSSLLDQHLAERMAGGTGQKLVNAMVHKLENPGTKRKPEPSKKPAWQAKFPGQYRKALPKSDSQAKDRRPNVTTDFRA